MSHPLLVEIESNEFCFKHSAGAQIHTRDIQTLNKALDETTRSLHYRQSESYLKT